MFRNLVIAGAIALGVWVYGASAGPSSNGGSWQVDSRHSDAQIITDGTTNYGKSKINVTLGFARIAGDLKIDNDDLSKSRVDLHIFPATSVAEPIGEDGKYKSSWLASQANHTMLCFHSKQLTRTAGGQLQAKGDLTLVRVDRNVEVADPSEAYSGPTYGPPIVNRVTRELTFVFNLPPEGKEQKDGAIEASGSTKAFREDFPQLVKAVLNSMWPPVVLDKSCTVPDPSEAYGGAKCTGTFLETPAELASVGFPTGPLNPGAADYPGPQDFNAVVGERVDIALHLRLTPGGEGHMSAGN